MPERRHSSAYLRLLGVMDRLRDAGGCDWDRAQTLESLRPFLLEESHELHEVMAQPDPRAHREELGDVLFQIVFQSRIRAEAGEFDMADVCDGIADKLQRRHPELWPEGALHHEDGRPFSWNEVKAWERARRAPRPTDRAGLLGPVPTSLPALLRALRLSERAAGVGFDWDRPEQVLDKVDEEVGELREALDSGDRSHIRHEVGDLLFALANFARHLGEDPEALLQDANGRFTRRFHHIETALAAEGRAPSDASSEELEARWQDAKRALGDAC